MIQLRAEIAVLRRQIDSLYVGLELINPDGTSQGVQWRRAQPLTQHTPSPREEEPFRIRLVPE